MSAQRYGSFSLGGLSLALPMSHLREVQPLRDWIALPCGHPAVPGGMDLRGVVVPVLDLRRLLQQPAPELLQPCVVMMVHEGRMLGLLADGVQGIFEASDEALSGIRVQAGLSVFRASLPAGPDGPLLSLLDAAALAAIAGIPMADDPEPERQRDAALSAPGASGDAVAIDDPSVPMLLARSGRSLLAIDAMAVHATLSDPVIEPSVLARGICRGVIDYAGLKVPALALSELCRLGPLSDAVRWQALVLRLEAGLVACLVEQVVDVVRSQPEDLVPVPAFAMPHPQLFSGALPVCSLPAELIARAAIASPHFLVLDAQALRQDPELQGLAGSNTGLGATSESGSTLAADGQRPMITYAVGGETASPLGQVTEILPFSKDTVIYDTMGPLLGLAQHGGRAIPIVCLSRLAGLGPVTASPASSVLVVNCGEHQVGFAVPALKSIEPAEWEPSLPRTGPQGDALQQCLAERPLALVGQGPEQRMLRVLDLQRIATALCDAEMTGACQAMA